MLTVLLPLLLALLAAPVTALAGTRRTTWAAPVGSVMAALAFGATLASWLAGGGTVDVPWAPTWNLRLTLALDGLAALYALLATGIGFLIVVYSARYLPLHLEHEKRPQSEAVRFYAFLLLFMGAMVGLAMAQDLILLFVFWDVTAIASYFLIGYDQENAEARRAALMALLVTGITSVFFLIGALMLFAEYGTFSLPMLFEQVVPGRLVTAAVALVALAALAKSAQVPFHFWLPRAMAAPTPVSAYLHSAAMVAAGVFLLSRIYPLLQTSPVLLDVLLGLGLLSMFVGSVFALTRDTLKGILAYSTIAQYGYVVVMLALGGSTGAAGASFYVVAHALVKSALFLTAGAVTEATEEDRLSRVGGLWRSMPTLAIGSGVVAAGLAGLPLTIGFFKDEVLFETALEHGQAFAALAVLGAALTLAYTWRFWSGIFLGESQPGEIHEVPVALVTPVVALALVAFVGGVVVGPFARLAEAAGAASLGAPTPIDLAYHFDLRPVNVLALTTYTGGVLLIVSRSLWEPLATAAARIGDYVGPERWYRVGLRGLNRNSQRAYLSVVPDLADRIVMILLPGAVLLGLGLWASPTEGFYRPGAMQVADLPLIVALILTAVAAVIMVLSRQHLMQVLTLAIVDYSLAAVYAFFGAPDVALVAVLIGTISTLFLLGVLVLLPREELERQVARPTTRHRWPRDAFVGIVAGIFTFIVSWAVLSQEAASENVAVEQMRLTPAAHAGDVVTAILADFRGLDTMGEITVITIVLVGVATLIQARGAS